MDINREKKTITGSNWEMPIIANYIQHNISKDDRANWKVTIECDGVPEDTILYRGKKT